MNNLTVETVFRNERHDLDRSILRRPANHPNNPTGAMQDVTLRMELADGRRGFRADVLLVNARQPHCPTCSCSGGDTFHQYAIEVTREGILVGPREAFDLISAEDRAWAEAEAQAMLATAAECPAFGEAFLR